MKKPSDIRHTDTDLRRRAEHLLDSRPEIVMAPETDIADLIHELRVRQIELEIQNAELYSAREEAETVSKHYTALYDFAPVGYLSVGRDSTIAQLNLAAATLIGRERGKLAGKLLGTFIYDTDRPVFGEFLNEIFSNDVTADCEVRLENQAGTGACFVRLVGQNDTKGGCRLSMVDITAARQAAVKLRESEERYRTMVENSMDGVLLTTPGGEILAANAEAERILGYTEQELRRIGRNGVVDRDDPRVALALAERGRTGRFRRELTVIRKNGTRCPVEASSLVFEDSAGRQMTSMLIHDISVQKGLEREILKRRSEMDALQRTQIAVQTAAAIAHEVNQPLSVITQFSEALAMLAGKDSPNLALMRKTSQSIAREALRAGQSIRHLLTYLSMQEFPREALDLNKEIADVLELVWLEHASQFKTVLQVEEGLPMVFANRTHLHKVLSNLLNNGIDAMLAAAVPLPQLVISVQTRKDERLAMISVQDNGPGIAQQDIDRIFDWSFTTKKNGIGMGLAISRSLLEANGGQLWLDPAEVPGATFRLTLPLAS